MGFVTFVNICKRQFIYQHFVSNPQITSTHYETQRYYMYTLPAIRKFIAVHSLL